MDFLRLVLVLKAERHEFVGADDAVDEVRAALDHALVDELLERLLLADATQVVEEHVPETRVHEVARGVLDAADVEVDRTPVLIGLLADQRRVVVRVHVAQVVGRRPGEPGHGRELVGVSLGGAPPLDAGQRRLAFGRGAEVLDGRELQRQLVGRKGIGRVVLIVDGERLAPIALAREDRVAQTVVDQPLAQAAALDLVEHQTDSLLDVLAVEEVGVDHATLLGVVGLLFEVAALDDGDDLEPEVAGESIVARVVGRNGHDRAGAVAGQHVVGDIDRNGLAGKGVDGAGTRGHAADALGLGDALALGTLAGLGDVLLDGGPVVGRREFIDPLVLGGDDHEGHAEDRVGARGEDFELAVRALDVEEDLRADRAADPVALDLLERIAPGELVQPVEHALGVGRDAQEPLLHAFLLDGVAAAHRQAVAHLVVGQHGAELGAPVDHRVGAVGEAVVLQHLLLAGLVPAVPLGGREAHIDGAGGVEALAAVFGECLDELGDGARLMGIVAVVVVVHLEERPLRPLVIGRVAGADFALPVEREADLVQLLAVAGDVALGGDGGVLARLDGVLLGGETERVVAHGVQDVEALEPLVARIDVRGDVPQRMPHVQACPRGVGEHVEDVVFGPRGVGGHLVGAALLPALLPLGFDLSEIVFHLSPV